MTGRLSNFKNSRKARRTGGGHSIRYLQGPQLDRWHKRLAELRGEGPEEEPAYAESVRLLRAALNRL